VRQAKTSFLEGFTEFNAK